MKDLKDITIKEYSEMLRCGADVSDIDKQLSTMVGGQTGGDILLFMLQKDLLLFQCKAAKAYFEFDDAKMAIYNKKIEALQKDIAKKKPKTKKLDPYKSFLSWILAVEKYLTFAIDKNNDLMYLVEATKQMINYYEMQQKQLENGKNKNSR